WSRETALPNVVYMRERMAQMALAGDAHNVQRADFAERYAGLPETWSHEWGLVMGWLVGDGWVSDGRTRQSVGFVFADDEARAQIHEPLTEWFGPGSLVERGNLKQLTYGGVPFLFFNSLGVKPVHAAQKRVPESIWTAPREAVVGFLQGLFGADGTLGVNEKKMDCTVRLASSSRELLEGVQL